MVGSLREALRLETKGGGVQTQPGKRVTKETVDAAPGILYPTAISCESQADSFRAQETSLLR